MTVATSVFKEKYESDVRTRNKRVIDANRPSPTGLDCIKSVLGSADSRFISFERTSNVRQECFTVYLASTGFVLRDDVRLVLRREESREYEMSGECWTLEIQFKTFGLRRRVTIEDTVELAEYCVEVPATDDFA